MDENLIWQPHLGPQEDFCSRGEFEVLYGGSAGPGKTDCIIMEATRYVWHPQYKAIILRRTFPQLQEIIDRTRNWYPLIDDGADYKSSEHRWYWPSGAFIQLGHMQFEADKYNYQGKEYHYAAFDELTQFSQGQYLYIHSRVRTSVSDIPIRIRASTNPGGIGHRWVKERFIDVAVPGETYIDPESGQSRVFIPGKISDNPTLMLNDPAYVMRLNALPEVERKRLRDGDWTIFEGQAFPELSMRVHGCDPFEIPPEWEKFMAFDWGYSKPFSIAWYAIDFDGIMYRYREWYGCKESPDGKLEPDQGLKMSNVDIARGIIDREKEKVRFRVADPACWSSPPPKDGMKGPSIIEDMQKEGLYFIKADNNRMLGKNQVHQRLRIENDIDPETGEVKKEYPQIVIFNNQKHFWRTMEDLRLDVKNGEDVDSDQEDHIYDEFRYACMARPVKPKKKDHVPRGTFQAERNRYINAKNYAQRHGVSLETAYGRVR
jgi:hypothetical protein